MNDRKARELLFRSVDGELTPEETRAWRALLQERPELAAEWEAARRDKQKSDAWSAALAPRRPGLEEAVLSELGHQPKWGRRGLAALAFAAIALLCVSIWWAGRDDEVVRRVNRQPTATFESADGAVARSLERGVFSVGDGRTEISVDEPTLVQTPIGDVQLGPGLHELTTDPNWMRLWVRKGSARLRVGDQQIDVAAGQTKRLRLKKIPVRKSLDGTATDDVGSNNEKKRDSDAAADVRVFGVVLDVARKPIAQARVYGGPEDVLTDAEGRFDFLAVSGAWIGVQMEGRAPVDNRQLPKNSTVAELRFVMSKKGGTLIVKATDDEGHAIDGADVRVGGTWRDVGARTTTYKLRAAPAQNGKTVHTGEARFIGMAPEWNPIRIHAAGFAPYQGWVRVPPDGETTRPFKLRRAGVVTGIVRNSDGENVAGASISFRQAGSATTYEGISAQTDAAGVFRIENAPVGRVEIVADSEAHGAARAWIVVKPGAEQAWSASLERRWPISGRILDLAGEPINGAEVSCRRAFRGAGSVVGRLVTKADGAFSFDPQLNALHELWIWTRTGRRARMSPPDHRIKVSPKDSPQDLKVERIVELAPGWVRGTMILSSGEAATATRVVIWPDGQPGWRLTSDTVANGKFRIGPVKPGLYTIEIHRDGESTIHRSGIVVGEGAETDLGAQQFATPGRVHARFLRADKTPYVSALHVSVTSLDQDIRYSVKQNGDGTALSETLSPGRYLVSGAAPGLFEEVEVVSGKTTEVEVVVRNGQGLRATFQRADGSASRELRYRILDEKGRLALRGHLDNHDNSVSVWLVSGLYRILAEDGEGRSAESKITIKAGGEAEQITVTLP